MSVLGDDVLYVSQWPWTRVDDWWNYRDRKKIKTEYAEHAQSHDRGDAEFESGRRRADLELSSAAIKYGDNEVDNVFILGTTSDYTVTSTVDFNEGRFFNEIESRDGANVCVIGYDVADALFPRKARSANRS